jgi:hypothetical protein
MTLELSLEINKKLRELLEDSLLKQTLLTVGPGAKGGASARRQPCNNARRRWRQDDLRRLGARVASLEGGAAAASDAGS